MNADLLKTYELVYETNVTGAALITLGVVNV